MSPHLNPLKYEAWLYGSSIEANVRMGPGKGTQGDIFSFYNCISILELSLFPSGCHSPPSVFNSASPSCHHSAHLAPFSSQSNITALSFFFFSCGYDTTVTLFRNIEVCSNRNWDNGFMNACVFELTSLLQCFLSKSSAFKNSGPLLKTCRATE